MTRIRVTLTLPDVADLSGYREEWRTSGWHYAQLHGEGPSLTAVLSELAELGRPLELQGGTAQPGPAPLSWLRRVAGDWQRKHPEFSHGVWVSTEVWRPGMGRKTGEWRLVTGAEAALKSPAWQELPPARYHLLVCRGPRCNAAGAQKVHEAINAELRERGATDDDVLVTTAGCMYPCNHAPLVCVYPDAMWRHVPNAEEAVALVSELLHD